MPIYNVGEDSQNKRAVFGSGDIKLSGGHVKHDKSIGLILLRNQAPQPIGTLTEYEKPEEIDSNEAPITLAFHKVESVDVFIRNLEKLKSQMLNV